MKKQTSKDDFHFDEIKKAADLPTEAKRWLLRKTATEDEIIAGNEPDGLSIEKTHFKTLSLPESWIWCVLKRGKKPSVRQIKNKHGGSVLFPDHPVLF